MLLHCFFPGMCVLCRSDNEVAMRLCAGLPLKTTCVDEERMRQWFLYLLPIYIFSPFPLDTRTHVYHQNASSHNALRRIFTDKKWRLEKKYGGAYKPSDFEPHHATAAAA